MNAGQNPTMISLVPSDFDPTNEGLMPFYWPVSRQEILTGSHKLCQTLIETLALAHGEGLDVEYLVDCSSKLTLTLTSLLQALLLTTRSRKDQVTLKVDPQARIWSALLAGQPVRANNLSETLAAGLTRAPHWRRWLRPALDWKSDEVFRRRPVELIHEEKDIVVVADSPLIRKMATKLDQRPKFVPLNEWFYKPTAQDWSQHRKAGGDPAVIAALVHSLSADYLALEAPLNDQLQGYLRDWLADISSWYRYYAERIQRHSLKVPKNLWIGTAGIHWARILSRVVRQKGGVVTGHDHAHGSNYNLDALQPFSELNGCDQFVTFSPAHIDLFQTIGSKQMIDRPLPKLIDANFSKPVRKNVGTGPVVRSIMYLTPFCTRDQTGPFALMSPMVAIDWQCRLFHFLQQKGYRLLQKPHPESNYPPPAAYAEKFGVEAVGGKLEQEIQRADLILLDWHLTTTFGFVLNSDRSVVTFDFGLVNWPEDVRRGLAKRTALVPAWHEENNRVNCDWDRLERAIQEAPNLRDYSVAAALFPMES